MNTHKNSLASRIVGAVERGDLMSIPQMAKRFDTSESMVNGTLVRLRRRGYHYYSVGSVTNPQNPRLSKPGTIVDIISNEDHFMETSIRREKDIRGRVERNIKSLESAVIEFPHLKDEIIKSLNNTTIKLLGGQNDIRRLSSPRYKKDGDQTDTDKKDNKGLKATKKVVRHVKGKGNRKVNRKRGSN